MAYPVAAGEISHSGIFIPELWTTQLLPKFYDATVVAQMANTDYEGEISKMGDKVKIRNVPDVVIRDYVKGQDLKYTQPEGEVINLNIDQGKYFAFPCNDVDKIQSDIALMETWSSDASEQLKITIDTDILGSIYADVSSENSGATAGRLSGNINLGTTGAPVSITQDTVLDSILDLGLALDEQNVPEQGRFIVVPAWFSAKIKGSSLKDASLAGDGTSILRNGRVGMIDRFEVYSSNLLPSTTDGSDTTFYCYAGHKSGLTFASQLTNMENLRNPNDFGDLIRGLQIYGYKVVKPTSLATLYCKRGTEA